MDFIFVRIFKLRMPCWIFGKKKNISNLWFNESPAAFFQYEIKKAKHLDSVPLVIVTTIRQLFGSI